MHVRRQQITRRTLLQGIGVTMTLPWLESLPTFAQSLPTNSTIDSGDLNDALPLRFAVLFMGNGINPDHWWAKGSGDAMELGKSLEPLMPLRRQVSVIHGLYNRAATGVGIHPGQTGNILSGAALQRGPILRGGISVDQVLADRFRDVSLQPSLVLGCEQPITGYHETNFSMAYSSHISWHHVDSPVPMEVYPSLAFDSLFSNHGSQRRVSILDRVQEHARSIRRDLSHADGQRLDEYLTSVREVEQRIERMRVLQDQAASNHSMGDQSAAWLPRPDNGLPEDIREHMRLMCDIIAMAFQTDKSRVASLLLCRDLSGLFYPFLDVRTAHHPASHDDQSDAYERVSRFYCSQFAYLASRLDAMKEGNGTVLDRTCLLFLSNMWSGSRHDSSKVPLLMAGSLGGRLPTGQTFDFSERADDDRKLCSLYLSILQAMGVTQKAFGDAEKTLWPA